jgi:hypothetical protein
MASLGPPPFEIEQCGCDRGLRLETGARRRPFCSMPAIRDRGPGRDRHLRLGGRAEPPALPRRAAPRRASPPAMVAAPGRPATACALCGGGRRWRLRWPRGRRLRRSRLLHGDAAGEVSGRVLHAAAPERQDTVNHARTASAKSYSQMTPRSCRDAAQQRVVGAFIPVGTWRHGMVCKP